MKFVKTCQVIDIGYVVNRDTALFGSVFTFGINNISLVLC